VSKATTTRQHPAGKPAPTSRQRRLNLRALAILAALLVVALPSVIALRMMSVQRGRTTLLREARTRYEKGQPGMALNFLNRYLELAPDDLQALDLKSQILAEGALASGSQPQMQEAARLHSAILGRDPSGPGRLETRRRLVRLSTRLATPEPPRQALPGQAQVAEEQAAKLIADLSRRGGKADAEAYRLHALAWERVAASRSSNQDVARDLDKALKAYLEAEALEPGDVQGAALLAAFYRERLNKPDEALKVLDRAVEVTRGKDRKKHAQALLARGLHFGASRDYKKAEDDFDRAAGEDPSNVEVRIAAAETAMYRHDTATARRHLAAIPPDQRADRQVALAQGRLEMVEMHPDDAIQIWQAGLLKTKGSDEDLTWHLAHVLLELGRVKEGEQLVERYKALVGGNEPGPKYEFLVGLAALQSKHPREAIRTLEAARLKAPALLLPNLYWKLGQAYELNRETSKALDAYRESAKLSKDWGTPWLAAADLQLRTSQSPAEAASTLREGLAQMPGDPQLLAALTQLVWREQMRKPKGRQDPAEIEALLRRANEAAPGSPEVAIIQSEFLAATKGLDEALALLETACRQRPGSTQLWLARANMLLRRNQIGEALGVLDEAVARAGPHAQLFITRSSYLAMKGDVGKAKAALLEGLTRAPVEERSLLWKTLGDTYVALREYPSAKDAYNAWARLQPTNPDPKVALVELAIAAGDEPAIDRAVEEVRQVDGERGYFWRYARVQDLLRDRPGEKPDPGRVEKADRLVREIQQADPQLPLGDVLRGRVEEKRGRADAAIKAYEDAVGKNGADAALKPLVALLVRDGRDADLARLSKELSATPGRVEQLAAVEALRQGNKGRAEQLAAEALKGNPQALDLAVWQADVLKALGKPEEAETRLRELIAKKPEEPAPYIQLLMLQVSQGQREKAAATVEQMMTHVKTAYPQLLRAQCYRAAGETKLAAEAYRESLRRWPEESAVLTSAVTFFEQSGLRDDAESVLRSMLRAGGSSAWARRRLAELLATRPNNHPAWAEALTLIGPDDLPDDLPDDKVTRAKVYAGAPTAEGRARAVTILRGLLREVPQLVAVQELLARVLLAQGKAPEAREPAALAAAGDRATVDAVLLYAGVLLAVKDLDGAEAQLGRLARFEPTNLAVTELRARLLVGRRQAKEAASLLEKAFEARAGAPDGLAIGRETTAILLRIGQPEAAERVARRAAELGPKGRCTLAELLAGKGRLDEAAAQLEQAAKGGDPGSAAASALGLAVAPKADPRWVKLADRFMAELTRGRDPSFDLYDKQALLRHLQGRYRDEVGLYRNMLDMSPPNYLFLNNMAWTYSEELKDPKEGLKWADEAVAKLGPLPAVLDTRGVILTRLSEYDKAVRDLESAIRDVPAGSFFYHLARAYLKMGKPDQARKQRDRAVEAGLTRDQLQSSELDDWDKVMALEPPPPGPKDKEAR
jgi:tetratricopeptide (TPR) repeat protein